MIKRRMMKFAAAGAAAVALSLGTPLTPVSVASAVTVTATVPNNFVNVYKCSRFNGRCAYQYTYQTNGAYNPSVPSRYTNRYDYCWCWV